MTNPQLSAANTANGVSAGGMGLGLACGDVRDGRGEARGLRLGGKSGLGVVGLVGVVEREDERSRGRKEARTRDDT